MLAPIDHDEFVKHDYKVEGESERVVSVADRKTMVDLSIPLTHSRTHARTHARSLGRREQSQADDEEDHGVQRATEREMGRPASVGDTEAGCLGG